MVTAEAHPIEYVLGRGAKGLAQEELGHQAAGGGPLRTEGEGLATQAVRQFFQILGRRNAGTGVGNEIGLEGLILHPLGEGLGPRDQPAGLDAGQAAKPGQLHLIVAKRRDGGGIGLHRNVANLHIQLFRQIVGNPAKTLDQLGFVLIRNGGEDEGLGPDSRTRKQQQCGRDDFPYRGQ